MKLKADESSKATERRQQEDRAHKAEAEHTETFGKLMTFKEKTDPSEHGYAEKVEQLEKDEREARRKTDRGRKQAKNIVGGRSVYNRMSQALKTLENMKLGAESTPRTKIIGEAFIHGVQNNQSGKDIGKAIAKALS